MHFLALIITVNLLIAEKNWPAHHEAASGGGLSTTHVSILELVSFLS